MIKYDMICEINDICVVVSLIKEIEYELHIRYNK